MAYLADWRGLLDCFAAGILALSVASGVRAQPIAGDQLALRSTGSASSGDWTIDRNGYVGTYIELESAGLVTINVNASGTASGGIDPHMNIVVADMKAGFDVANVADDYEYPFNLPAGTYFVRVELNNDLEASARQLTVRDITIDGANVLNSSNNTNALAAADTYVEHFRRGSATVGLSGLAPGTPVEVRLKRHEFNFGTAIPNSFTDTFLAPPEAPYANPNAADFQEKLAESRFNSLSPENAGKWDANEGTRDQLAAAAVNPNGGPNIPYIDRISDYAQEHNIRFRQHNLIWGRNPQGGVNQQPAWSDAMLQNPTATDGASGDMNSVALRDEITERIEYYVRDRADRYYEVDVYNESYHTGSNQNHSSNTYWDVYGVDGIASIYKEVKDAIEDADVDVKAYINEYNVLQNQGGDFYANWYLQHFDALQSAGRDLYDEDVVDGIGFQYYASSGGFTGHNPARIYAVMHNLATSGLPMHLTEFGVSSGTTNQETQADILSEALRLVFGMPDTTGFTMWGFWAGSVWSGAPNGVLYNQDWSIRPAGTAWNDLQDQWHTELDLEVGPDGTIDFTGFYGDYELEIDGQFYELTLTKGQELYSLPIAPGDYNGDGKVDAGDYVTWRNTLGTDDLRADGDGDGMIGPGDYAVWKDAYGTNYGSGSGQLSGAVPEPTTLGLLGIVAACAPLRRRSNWNGRVRI